MTNYYFCFRINNYNADSVARFVQLMQCFSIIQSLPEDALEEANIALKAIADFYLESFPQADLNPISSSSIKITGKLKPARLRLPIVLE